MKHARARDYEDDDDDDNPFTSIQMGRSPSQQGRLGRMLSNLNLDSQQRPQPFFRVDDDINTTASRRRKKAKPTLVSQDGRFYRPSVAKTWYEDDRLWRTVDSVRRKTIPRNAYGNRLPFVFDARIDVATEERNPFEDLFLGRQQQHDKTPLDDDVEVNKKTTTVVVKMSDCHGSIYVSSSSSSSSSIDSHEDVKESIVFEWPFEKQRESPKIPFGIYDRLNCRFVASTLDEPTTFEIERSNERFFEKTLRTDKLKNQTHVFSQRIVEPSAFISDDASEGKCKLGSVISDPRLTPTFGFEEKYLSSRRGEEERKTASAHKERIPLWFPVNSCQTTNCMSLNLERYNVYKRFGIVLPSRNVLDAMEICEHVGEALGLVDVYRKVYDINGFNRETLPGEYHRTYDDNRKQRSPKGELFVLNDVCSVKPVFFNPNFNGSCLMTAIRRTNPKNPYHDALSHLVRLDRLSSLTTERNDFDVIYKRVSNCADGCVENFDETELLAMRNALGSSAFDVHRAESAMDGVLGHCETACRFHSGFEIDTYFKNCNVIVPRKVLFPVRASYEAGLYEMDYAYPFAYAARMLSRLNDDDARDAKADDYLTHGLYKLQKRLVSSNESPKSILTHFGANANVLKKDDDDDQRSFLKKELVDSKAMMVHALEAFSNNLIYGNAEKIKFTLLQVPKYQTEFTCAHDSEIFSALSSRCMRYGYAYKKEIGDECDGPFDRLSIAKRAFDLEFDWIKRKMDAAVELFWHFVERDDPTCGFDTLVAHAETFVNEHFSKLPVVMLISLTFFSKLQLEWMLLTIPTASMLFDTIVSETEYRWLYEYAAYHHLYYDVCVPVLDDVSRYCNMALYDAPEMACLDTINDGENEPFARGKDADRYSKCFPNRRSCEDEMLEEERYLTTTMTQSSKRGGDGTTERFVKGEERRPVNCRNACPETRYENTYSRWSKKIKIPYAKGVGIDPLKHTRWGHRLTVGDGCSEDADEVMRTMQAFVDALKKQRLFSSIVKKTKNRPYYKILWFRNVCTTLGIHANELGVLETDDESCATPNRRVVSRRWFERWNAHLKKEEDEDETLTDESRTFWETHVSNYSHHALLSLFLLSENVYGEPFLYDMYKSFLFASKCLRFDMRLEDVLGNLSTNEAFLQKRVVDAKKEKYDPKKNNVFDDGIAMFQQQQQPPLPFGFSKPKQQQQQQQQQTEKLLEKIEDSPIVSMFLSHSDEPSSVVVAAEDRIVVDANTKRSAADQLIDRASQNVQEKIWDLMAGSHGDEEEDVDMMDGFSHHFPKRRNETLMEHACLKQLIANSTVINTNTNAVSMATDADELRRFVDGSRFADLDYERAIVVGDVVRHLMLESKGVWDMKNRISAFGVKGAINYVWNTGDSKIEDWTNVNVDNSPRLKEDNSMWCMLREASSNNFIDQTSRSAEGAYPYNAIRGVVIVDSSKQSIVGMKNYLYTLSLKRQKIILNEEEEEEEEEETEVELITASEHGSDFCRSYDAFLDGCRDGMMKLVSNYNDACNAIDVAHGKHDADNWVGQYHMLNISEDDAKSLSRLHDAGRLPTSTKQVLSSSNCLTLGSGTMSILDYMHAKTACSRLVNLLKEGVSAFGEDEDAETIAFYESIVRLKETIDRYRRLHCGDVGDLHDDGEVYFNRIVKGGVIPWDAPNPWSLLEDPMVKSKEQLQALKNNGRYDSDSLFSKKAFDALTPEAFDSKIRFVFYEDMGEATFGSNSSVVRYYDVYEMIRFYSEACRRGCTLRTVLGDEHMFSLSHFSELIKNDSLDTLRAMKSKVPAYMLDAATYPFYCLTNAYSKLKESKVLFDGASYFCAYMDGKKDPLPRTIRNVNGATGNPYPGFVCDTMSVHNKSLRFKFPSSYSPYAADEDGGVESLNANQLGFEMTMRYLYVGDTFSLHFSNHTINAFGMDTIYVATLDLKRVKAYFESGLLNDELFQTVVEAKSVFSNSGSLKKGYVERSFEKWQSFEGLVALLNDIYDERCDGSEAFYIKTFVKASRAEKTTSEKYGYVPKYVKSRLLDSSDNNELYAIVREAFEFRTKTCKSLFSNAYAGVSFEEEKYTIASQIKNEMYRIEARLHDIWRLFVYYKTFHEIKTYEPSGFVFNSTSDGVGKSGSGAHFVSESAYPTWFSTRFQDLKSEFTDPQRRQDGRSENATQKQWEYYDDLKDSFASEKDALRSEGFDEPFKMWTGMSLAESKDKDTPFRLAYGGDTTPWIIGAVTNVHCKRYEETSVGSRESSNICDTYNVLTIDATDHAYQMIHRSLIERIKDTDGELNETTKMAIAANESNWKNRASSIVRSMECSKFDSNEGHARRVPIIMRMGRSYKDTDIRSYQRYLIVSHNATLDRPGTCLSTIVYTRTN